jgi:hypothetical protein
MSKTILSIAVGGLLLALGLSVEAQQKPPKLPAWIIFAVRHLPEYEKSLTGASQRDRLRAFRQFFVPVRYQ